MNKIYLCAIFPVKKILDCKNKVGTSFLFDFIGIEIKKSMYTYTWKKYLPVIRILLKKSATEEQSVNLNRIDFERSTKLRKPVVTFNVDVVKGRLNPINKSVPAKDLIEILQEDETARSLMREHQYSISLNGDFLLSIKNITPQEEETSENGKDEEVSE